MGEPGVGIASSVTQCVSVHGPDAGPGGDERFDGQSSRFALLGQIQLDVEHPHELKTYGKYGLFTDGSRVTGLSSLLFFLFFFWGGGGLVSILRKANVALSNLSNAHVTVLFKFRSYTTSHMSLKPKMPPCSPVDFKGLGLSFVSPEIRTNISTSRRK